MSLRLLVGISAALLVVDAGLAKAQDATYGKQIFYDKAQCNQCHGWAGDGHGDDPRQSGANLREAKLDRAGLIETISCGRPGTAMPHFDKFAYTDKRCYGATADELGDKVPDIPPSGFLPKIEIEAVADFLLANIVGKGPVSSEECV